MTNGQRPPKCLYGSTFWEFWHQEFVWWRKTWSNYLWKFKLFLSKQTILSKLTQSLKFVYFNGLLPCPLGENLSRSSRLDDCSVNQGSLFWLQSEGEINFGWCISRGKYSLLLRKELYSQKREPWYKPPLSFKLELCGYVGFNHSISVRSGYNYQVIKHAGIRSCQY